MNSDHTRQSGGAEEEEEKDQEPSEVGGVGPVPARGALCTLHKAVSG